MPSVKDKPGLLEEALPAPDQPHCRRRSLSTSLLLCWLLVICYLALTYSGDSNTMLNTRKPSWIDSKTADSVIDLMKHKATVDLGQYRSWHQDLNWKNKGRLIVVGDVHGQADSVKALLDVLGHSNEEDTLVFAGDLIGKHPKTSASLEMLDYIQSLNSTNVRGNHDQYSIGWRAWMELNRPRLDSTDLAESQLLQQTENSLVSDSILSSDLLLSHPKEWKKHVQHFKIARALSTEQYQYLSSLPLTLYVETINTFIVHAGLLPASAPRSGYVRPKEAGNEPDPAETDSTLSVVPDMLNSINPAFFTPSSPVFASLKAHKAKSVLLVEQNRDPYTLVEMRGVSKHGTPHRKDEGDDWWKLWNNGAKMCAKQQGKRFKQRQKRQDEDEEEADDPDRIEVAGSDVEDEEEELEAESKKGSPTNIIYGHWKSQGLNIQDYTVGLDSGCVYGGQLSALVVGESRFSTDRMDITTRDISINGRNAQIVSLDCQAPTGGPV